MIKSDIPSMNFCRWQRHSLPAVLYCAHKSYAWNIKLLCGAMDKTSDLRSRGSKYRNLNRLYSDIIHCFQLKLVHWGFFIRLFPSEVLFFHQPTRGGGVCLGDVCPEGVSATPPWTESQIWKHNLAANYVVDGNYPLAKDPHVITNVQFLPLNF